MLLPSICWSDANLDKLFDEIRPRTVINCAAWRRSLLRETESGLIYRTNFLLTSKILARAEAHKVSCYLHAGSSSEYGDNAAAPAEDAPSAPNSDYAVSKVACAQLIHFYGKKKRLPCANLRLYSIYGPLRGLLPLDPGARAGGPWRDAIPTWSDPISRATSSTPTTSSRASSTRLLNLKEEDYGESFNVGSERRKTTIRDASAAAARDVFRAQGRAGVSLHAGKDLGRFGLVCVDE